MRKLRVGMVGSGICANNFHAPALKKLSDYYEPVALADANLEKSTPYAKMLGVSKVYADYKDLLADPEVEAVIASYPYALNEELIAAAKQAKKPILVEKPIAESMEKAVRIAAMDDGSLVMGVAENWLYWNVIDKIHEVIDSGAIGQPLMVQMYSYYNIDLDNMYLRGNAWRRTATGGMILDRTIHMVALVRAVFGSVKRATGMECGIRDELGHTDTMTTLLEYESGVKGTIINCASAPGIDVPYNMVILGKKGTISVTDLLQCVTVNTEAGAEVHTVDNGDGGYSAEFLDFYNAVVNGTKFRSDLHSACNDLFAVMTALENPGEWKTFNQKG
jgi:Predicted dehydrogenases and related proteins